MNGKYLLDTNIVIALFTQDLIVQQNLAKARTTFVSAITIGELYYGMQKSKQKKSNQQRIEEFVAHNVILPCDIDTAQYYAQIKHLLREKGQPIPEGDLWIAATAQQYQLTLVSRDKHFTKIEDLKLERW